MSNSILSANHAQPLPQTAAAPQPAPSKASAKSAPPAANDTVQISNWARQALLEAIENPAQTAHEAAGGDLQAKRLLAKEAADKAV
jgi:hypothetical protein